MCKKIKSEFHVFNWFPGLQNLDVFFLENFLWSYFGNHFLAEIVPYSPLFFDFITVFHMVWKHQESWEIWLDGFWGNRHLKVQKIFCWKFFCVFLRCRYGFTDCFEILNFVFSNIICRGVWTCKMLTF